MSSYSSQGDSRCGVADMAANVWEWTATEEMGDRRVLRGGSFYFDQDLARCAFCEWLGPYLRGGYGGFRVVVSHLSARHSESLRAGSLGE